jgi:hypothetical protein
MFVIILSLLCSIHQEFRTRAAIQAEILALRHQLLILQRSARAHKVRLTASDRFLWANCPGEAENSQQMRNREAHLRALSRLRSQPDSRTATIGKCLEQKGHRCESLLPQMNPPQIDFVSGCSLNGATLSPLVTFQMARYVRMTSDLYQRNPFKRSHIDDKAIFHVAFE